MGNPARELAAYLQEWRVVPAGVSVYSVRGLGNQDQITFWRDQVRAAHLLGEVEQAIGRLGKSMNVEHHERSLESWYRGVFGPDTKWNESSPTARSFASQAQIDQLNGLADVLDLIGTSSPIAQSDGKTIRSAVDDILSLIETEDLGLSIAEKQYVFELIQSIRTLADENATFGSVDLSRRINELIGAVTTLAASLATDGQVPKAKKLWDAVSRVFRFGMGGARVAARGVEVAAGIQQLTTGGGS